MVLLFSFRNGWERLIGICTILMKIFIYSIDCDDENCFGSMATILSTLGALNCFIIIIRFVFCLAFIFSFFCFFSEWWRFNVVSHDCSLLITHSCTIINLWKWNERNIFVIHKWMNPSNIFFLFMDVFLSLSVWTMSLTPFVFLFCGHMYLQSRTSNFLLNKL